MNFLIASPFTELTLPYCIYHLEETTPLSLTLSHACGERE